MLIKHNGLWGDVADSGKYMNVETVDYRNTHSNKDGTPTDHNTFAHPENNPFRKLKDDGTYFDDSTNVDEMSGEVVINRVMGNQYTYFEGSVFSFNSTQDYNFGNNYEENHAWSGDHVPNNEAFVIPTLGASNERNQGIVNKTWANEYNYNYGTSRNWSGGPANQLIGDDGNVTADNSASAALKSGKFCAYSYGTGYEEVLIDQNDKDADAHYSNTKHNEWQSSFLGWSSSDVGDILVSKVFGKTYDYRNGDSREVKEGNTDELVYGNSNSETHGNSTESTHGNSTADVHGNSTETVHGNSTTTVYGNSTDTIHGNAVEFFAGGKAEFFTGGINSMSIAAVNEMALTGKIELTIGGVMSVMMGAVLEITLGLKMEIQAGGKIEVGELVDVKAKASAKIDACLTEIKNTAAAIKTAALQLFA